MIKIRIQIKITTIKNPQKVGFKFFHLQKRIL